MTLMPFHPLRLLGVCWLATGLVVTLVFIRDYYAEPHPSQLLLLFYAGTAALGGLLHRQLLGVLLLKSVAWLTLLYSAAWFVLGGIESDFPMWPFLLAFGTLSLATLLCYRLHPYD